jgi:hypothetical protein
MDDNDLNSASINAIQVLLDNEDAEETNSTANDLLLVKLREAATNDEEYQEVLNLIRNGFPRYQMPFGLRWVFTGENERSCILIRLDLSATTTASSSQNLFVNVTSISLCTFIRVLTR